MTQLDFDIIIRLINDGAPALAPRLTKVLTDFVQEKLQLDKEVSELREKVNSAEKKAESKKN